MKQIDKGPLRRAIVIFGIALMGLYANGPAALAGVVKIGVLAPLSGATASDGEEFVNGVKWAVEEANARGGVAGNTFEVVVADVKDHSAANVTSAVERLLGTDGVHMILTGYASMSMFEVQLMAEAGMPYLAAGPSPGFAAIVSKKPEDYWCCWSMTASFAGYVTDLLPTIERFAKAGTISIRNKKVAIISSDNPFSKTISEGMKKVFTAAGWTITVDELVPFGPVSDWRSILAKVRSDEPDLVVNTDYIPGNSALFVKQFQEKPTNSIMFLQYAPALPEFIKLTGAKANGVLYNLIGGPLDSPKWPIAQKMLKAYEAKFGKKSGPYGVALKEMTDIYFAALAKVGDATDHKAIGMEIGKTKVLSGAGPIEFGQADHLALQDLDHVPVSFWQIQNQKRVLVSPEKYAAGDFMRPPWMK